MILGTRVVQAMQAQDALVAALSRPMVGNEEHLYLYGSAFLPLSAVLRRPLAQLQAAGMPPEAVRVLLGTREQGGEIRLVDDSADRSDDFLGWLTTATALADGEEFFLDGRSGGRNLMMRSLLVDNRDPERFADLFQVQKSEWHTRGAMEAKARWVVKNGEPAVSRSFEPVAVWCGSGGDAPVVDCARVLLQVITVAVPESLPEAGLKAGEVGILLVAEPHLVGYGRSGGGPEANNALGDAPDRMLSDAMSRHSATARQMGIALWNLYVERFDDGHVPDPPDTLEGAFEISLLALDELIRESPVLLHMEDHTGVLLGQAPRYAEWLFGAMSADAELGRAMVRQIVQARRSTPSDDVSILAIPTEAGAISLSLVRREHGNITQKEILVG